jgi:aryl-alcohol dehydrogenase-like predicted oxidoreductase
VKRNRGDWITASLNDRPYANIETLAQVAQEAGVTPAGAALKWLHCQPGVTSTITGARTIEQLDENLASLDETLRAELLQRLSEASELRLDFPASVVKRSVTFRPDTVVGPGAR